MEMDVDACCAPATYYFRLPLAAPCMNVCVLKAGVPQIFGLVGMKPGSMHKKDAEFMAPTICKKKEQEKLFMTVGSLEVLHNYFKYCKTILNEPSW
jgi:hypothetical protein